jgi:hypothetical protein
MADGVRRAMNCDVLYIYTSNAVWKVPKNIEIFATSL